MHPPKSPKRFFTFSPTSPPPPLPSTSPSEQNMYFPYQKHHTPSSSYSSTSSNLGFGATVVRTPQEALAGMKKPPLTARVTGSYKEVYDSRESVGLATAPPRPVHGFSPPRPVIRSGNGHSAPQSSKTELMPRNSSLKGQRPSLSLHHTDSTIKPPPKGSLPPLPVLPFEAKLLSFTLPPLSPGSPAIPNDVILILEFAYNLDDEPRNAPVRLPFDVLKRTPGGGGHLVDFVERCLKDEGVKLRGDRSDSVSSRYDDEPKPEMTDGSSAEESDLESDYGLGALLRDEYLLSLALVANEDYPTASIPTTGKKRAQTRNQYIQLERARFPTLSSAFIPPPVPAITIPPSPPKHPLNKPTEALSPQTAPLTISKKLSMRSPQPILRRSGGKSIEIRILLLRDAGAYHSIIHRLLTGFWRKMDIEKRYRVQEEINWLGMKLIVGEQGDKKV